MLKLFFVPLNVIGGIAAGAVGKKTFEARWVAFDDEQAPRSRAPQDLLKKLIAALMLEGAILRAVRGFSDHAAQQAFRKLAGSWPAEP